MNKQIKRILYIVFGDVFTDSCNFKYCFFVFVDIHFVNCGLTFSNRCRSPIFRVTIVNCHKTSDHNWQHRYLKKKKTNNT